MSKLSIILVFALAITMPVVYADIESTLNEAPFKLAQLSKYKRALALDMVSFLKEPQNLKSLAEKLSSRGNSLDLVAFMKEVQGSRTANGIALLDQKIRQAKGIEKKVDSLLQVRLAFPEKGIPTNADFLISYLPEGNEKGWKYIEAFDLSGKSHVLDPFQAPEKQVLVVGLDARKDMKAGLELMNEELQKAGMQYTAPASREGLAVAKLDYIRLEDDKEPWLLGDSEIYMLVNGISPEAEKANVIALELPYLVTDKKDYFPNQVLIVWKNYRYMAANINVYEHDDNTNYKEIVDNLIKGIGQVVPEYQNIFEIASKIIQLMPDSWFSNDDDYVDVFYTLEKDKTYTKYMGASRNATITLVPYTIAGGN